MDPITAVGLALAVLPLIITVFENYKTAIHPFIMLRHSRGQAQKFGNSLGTQETIFINTCQHLLCLVTRDGPEMLSNHGHPLWRDNDLERKLCSYLNKSLNSCVSIVQDMKDTLGEIEKETHKGFQDLQKPKGESQISSRERISQKFKLAFSNTDLDKKVGKLRKYNGDLRILVDQVKTMEKHTTALTSQRDTLESIVSYQSIRKASRRLYEALSQAWSCSKHMEHSASICLDETLNRITPDKVTFDMIFTFSTPQRPTPTETPIRVTVESILDRPYSEYKDATEAEQEQKKSWKSVSFSLPSSIAPPLSGSSAMDLSSVQSICVYMQTSLESLESSTSSFPIGYLQRSQTKDYATHPIKHVIYPPKASKLYEQPIVSLSDALLAAQSNYGLWRPEKLRLAKTFARAVLQFHSTPWLDENWGSQDILFFNSVDPSSRKSLGPPCLKVRLVKPPVEDELEVHTVLTGWETSVSNPYLPVPNVLLFRLGVILLELALDVPFVDLQKREQKEGQSKEFIELFTARTLALGPAVRKQMGSRYSRLVNRCLFCDFGLGGNYELENSGLQNMFYQYVVLELEACLKTVYEYE